MTELIYQTDSYCQVFTAIVTGHDVEQNGVLLDRTAFYPGGGGQPNDVGTLIAGHPRLPGDADDVRGVLHVPEEVKERNAGDWEQRFSEVVASGMSGGGAVLRRGVKPDSRRAVVPPYHPGTCPQP